MSRSWNALVKQGRELVRSLRRHRLELGRLAVEVGDHTLAEYAEAINISTDALTQYRDVALAWPDADRYDQISWSILLELADEPDRVAILNELIKKHGPRPTVNQMRERMGRKSAGVRGTSSPTEQVRLIREWASKPEVAEVLAEDHETRWALEDVFRQRDQRTEREHEDYVRDRVPGLHDRLERWNAEHRIEQATTLLKIALQEIQNTDLDSHDRKAALLHLDKHDLVAGWLRSRLTEGRGFDAELEHLLRGVQ